MDKLSKDILFLIALELNDKDFSSLCQANKYFNEQICQKDDIWNYKIKNVENIQELKKEFKNSKEVYNFLISLNKISPENNELQVVEIKGHPGKYKELKYGFIIEGGEDGSVTTHEIQKDEKWRNLKESEKKIALRLGIIPV